jgi:hypothetical protein
MRRAGRAYCGGGISIDGDRRGGAEDGKGRLGDLGASGLGGAMS